MPRKAPVPSLPFLAPADGRPLLLLDCNALLLPFRERFPLENALAEVAPHARPAVSESVLGELEALVERNAPGARPAQRWAFGLLRVPSDGSGDDGLLRTALRERAWVLTGDVALLGRLSARGIPTLRPRGRATLAFDPGRGRPAARRRNPGAATVIKKGTVSRRRRTLRRDGPGPPARRPQSALR